MSALSDSADALLEVLLLCTQMLRHACVAECAISVGAGAVCVVAKGAVVLSAIVVSALAADNVDINTVA